MEEEKYYECAFCHENVVEYEAALHSCLDNNTLFEAIHVDKLGRFYPVLENRQLMLVPATIVGVIVAIEANRQEFDTRLFMEEVQEARRKEVPAAADGEIEEAKKGTKRKATTANKNKSVKKSKSCTQLDDHETEILISEIEKRPPLWNFTIPLPQRSKQIKETLYEEVSQQMNGKLNPEQVKAKFKSPKDTYRKILVSEQQASGAARSEDQPRWKYYNVMNFLSNTCLVQNNTRYNVPRSGFESMDEIFEEEETVENLSNSDNDSLPTSSVQKRTRQKRRSPSNQEEHKTTLTRIADFVCQSQTTIQFPTTPQLDELDALTTAATLQLRHLPYDTRMNLAMKFLQTVRSTVEEHRRTANA